MNTRSRIQPSPGAKPVLGDVQPDQAGSASDSDEISLLRLATVILTYRWWVFLGAMSLATCVVVLGLREHRKFTTSASFVPAKRSISAGGASSIAAQFGLSFPSTDPAQSPQFYVDLLTSDEILRALVNTDYVFRRDTGVVRGTLVDILTPRGKPRPVRVERAIGRLRTSINAGASLKTGVITFSVTAENPELAKQMGERMLDRLNTFNLESRAAQAATERRFTETRLDEVRNDLRAAEDRVQEFMQENRDFRSSARLSLDEQRLQRDVDMRQQVYTALVQAYEQAKIEELRDTPVITVLERPRAAVVPNSRGLLKRGVLAILGGALLVILFAFLREFFIGASESGNSGTATAEFKAVAREALADLRHPLRALSRKQRRATT